MDLLSPAPSSSGDLVADRRYRYAQAAAAEGDHAAAAEVLEQALELAPGWAPLWFALGSAREKLGARDAAITAFSRAASLDPGEGLGAELHLARLGARDVPRAAPDGYVRCLFDQYADRFDAHLVESLDYRGPALLADALANIGATGFSSVLDLGCGTGLCGAAFRASTRHLAGVDLSPRMVEAALRKGIYDRLDIGSIEEFLGGEKSGSASLVTAADVLVYCGDLAPILTTVARVLEPRGFLAITLQRAETGDYTIGSDLRFAHGEDYVRRAAAATGLRILRCETASTRKDAGADVPGLVVVAARTGR